jgi:hypothetical protein
MTTFRNSAAALLAVAVFGAPDAHAVNEKTADFQLGPAPRVDADGPLPPQPSFVPKAVQSVPAINTFDRNAVVVAYNTYYNVAMPAVGWTGSNAGCNPGAINLAFQEWTITRVNYLRAMAGVAGNTTLDTTLNAQEQAAALIMSANNTLNHDPPSSLLCWTQSGHDGAASSNLALGSFSDAISLYMSDPGNGNQVAGHRRWVLHSRKARFGMGQTNSANALYTFDFGVAQPSLPSGIPWPPRGYVPMALFPTPFGGEGQRWSFGLPNASFASATVTMAVNGVALPVNVVSRTDNGYGDNTIVWELPVGHAIAKNSVYSVAINGVTGASSTSFGYQVLPIDPTDPIPATVARLSNISTRGRVLTGNDVMIAGFVVGGPSPKTVVVNVAGPSLANFGIPSPLANPTLTLVRSSDNFVLGTNDDWQNQAAAAVTTIQGAGFQPNNPLEPALLATLAPGAYTAIVSGVGVGTGVALVGVFEVDRGDVPFTNISTRGQVQTGTDVMIAGFIVQGPSAKTVVINVAGPSLVNFGITNALLNPNLRLVRASDQVVLNTNDNWQVQSNPADVLAIQSTGYQPNNSLEPAIIATLQPGAYTAIVEGVGGTTGVGLVGVFAVP